MAFSVLPVALNFLMDQLLSFEFFFLSQLYSVAVEVDHQAVGESQDAGRGQGPPEVKLKAKVVRKFVPVLPGKVNFTDQELIFYTMSPDYCLPELDLGSVGTRGRCVTMVLKVTDVSLSLTLTLDVTRMQSVTDHTLPTALRQCWMVPSCQNDI